MYRSNGLIGSLGCELPAPNVYFQQRFAEAKVNHQLITLPGYILSLPSIHSNIIFINVNPPLFKKCEPPSQKQETSSLTLFFSYYRRFMLFRVMGFTIRGSHFLKRGFIFLEKGVHQKGGTCEPPEPPWLQACTIFLK